MKAVDGSRRQMMRNPGIRILRKDAKFAGVNLEKEQKNLSL